MNACPPILVQSSKIIPTWAAIVEAQASREFPFGTDPAGWRSIAPRVQAFGNAGQPYHWEIYSSISAAQLSSPGVITRDTVAPATLRAAARARLRIRPKPSEGVEEWYHDARGTVVVTSESVEVEMLIPSTAAVIGGGESLDATTGIAEIVQATIRVIGVPARGRRPSRMQITDVLVTLTDGGPTLFPVYPGMQEVRVDPAPPGVPSPATLVQSWIDASNSEPHAVLDPGVWTPATGATGVLISTVPEQGQIMVLTQRGEL